MNSAIRRKEIAVEEHGARSIFACYSPDSTVISHILFDNDLWSLAKTEIKNLISQRKQNKLPNQRTIFSKIVYPRKFGISMENVELLTKVPYVKGNVDDRELQDDCYEDNSNECKPQDDICENNSHYAPPKRRTAMYSLVPLQISLTVLTT